MTAHARLSPSGAERWMSCPGSVAASAGVADPGSVYAAEGTTAHALAELCLRRGLNADDLPTPIPGGEVIAETSLASPELDQAAAEWSVYPADMRGHVQTYLDYVRDAARGATLFVEERLEMSQWVPEGFGTADALILRDGHMELVDLKYGRGVRVTAAHNKQLMLYALGALQSWGHAFAVDRVRVTVVQPRLDHIDSWECDAAMLLEFAAEVRKAAAEALQPDAPRRPSESACQWCLVRGSCRARADANLAMAREDFRPPPELTLAEVARLLPELDEIASWCDDVRHYAMQQAEAGADVPGYKLVEGRSVRRWRDESEAAAALIAAGAAESAIWRRSLVGLGDAEKALGGKRKADPVLATITIRPPGKPALVPVSDPRPALSTAASAADDFSQPMKDENA